MNQEVSSPRSTLTPMVSERGELSSPKKPLISDMREDVKMAEVKEHSLFIELSAVSGQYDIQVRYNTGTCL